jgi:type IV pilus assembly protein PilC
MLTYKYTARDPASGEKIKAEVQAENEQAAAKLILSQGYSPINIEIEGGDSAGLNRVFHKIHTKEKILFSRQLSTLINAGLPLVQSLRSVATQTPSKQFKVVIGQVIADVESGQPFSQALSHHPAVFNQIYISLIASGETSGTLDASLERLATQQEKDAEVLSKVRGAMAYPLIVILIMVAVVGFMVVKVLPQVGTLYEGIPGANLPLLTRVLLAVSYFVIDYWWVVIISIVALVFFLSRWARTLGGKRFVDKAKMHMWPIGPLFMKMYMARFARTSATLVASGVPLIQVLDITSRSINNYHIEKSLAVATEKVRGGKSLSESLTHDPNFLELVPNMLRIGEQSGSIETMLEKTADYYEKEVDTQIKTISTIIEPVLMIVLGVVAFIIVAAVLLPIYQLAGQTIIR